MMTAEAYKSYFEGENLYTLKDADAQWAVKAAQRYGDEEIKRAAHVWHQDNVSMDECDAVQDRQNAEADCAYQTY